MTQRIALFQFFNSNDRVRERGNNDRRNAGGRLLHKSAEGATRLDRKNEEVGKSSLLKGWLRFFYRWAVHVVHEAVRRCRRNRINHLENALAEALG